MLEMSPIMKVYEREALTVLGFGGEVIATAIFLYFALEILFKMI